MCITLDAPPLQYTGSTVPENRSAPIISLIKRITYPLFFRFACKIKISWGSIPDENGKYLGSFWEAPAQKREASGYHLG